jgi:hypothetical protein
MLHKWQGLLQNFVCSLAKVRPDCQQRIIVVCRAPEEIMRRIKEMGREYPIQSMEKMIERMNALQENIRQAAATGMGVEYVNADVPTYPKIDGLIFPEWR